MEEVGTKLATRNLRAFLQEQHVIARYAFEKPVADSLPRDAYTGGYLSDADAAQALGSGFRWKLSGNQSIPPGKSI